MFKNKVSVQTIFLWNMLGSVSNALLAIFLLLAVSKMLSLKESDLYSFAHGIANPLSIIALFQVRNLQSTDVRQKYSFAAYMSSRIISCTLMLLVSLICILALKTTVHASLVIFFMCLYRCTDAVSDLFQGLFQQRERLDIAGKSLFFRNSLMLLFFTISLFFYKNLLLSLTVFNLISITFIVWFDMRRSLQFENWYRKSYFSEEGLIKKTLSLFKESLPLFVIGFLVMYIYSQPKYVIADYTRSGLLENGVQTTFGILFMPTFVMNLLMLFFRPLMTQMSIHLYEKREDLFKRTQKKLVLYLLAANLLCLVGSALIGIPFLNIFYGVNLNRHWLTFILLMLSGSLASFCVLLDNFLTVLRFQKFLIIPYLSAFLVSIFFTSYWVEHFKILGAAISFLVTVTVWLVISCLVYAFCRRRYSLTDDKFRA